RRSRGIKERPFFARIAIEIGEFFAIPALLLDASAIFAGDDLESAKSAIQITEPVSAFGVLALVDHIDSEAPLFRDDRFHGRLDLRLGIFACTVKRIDVRQTADMGGQNPAITALQ